MSEESEMPPGGPVGLDYPWIKQVEKPRHLVMRMKVLEPAAPFLEIAASVLASFKGLAVTLRHLIRRPVTIQYPEQRREPFQRFKGRHILDRHADGLEKCIGCELCAGACPADAILVIGAENTPEARYSPGERYAKTYEINYLRCIFCGLCVEACPTEALVMSHSYDLSADDRQSFIFTKEMLLVEAPLQKRESQEDLAEGEEVGEFKSIRENLERKREDAEIEAEQTL